ncbi:MAG TPA: platelet-activating factor acetylhydrolase IB subunit [Verrucomicrobiae bacterium]|jgi:lysophospholipase L1-like esterase|nr:platelet-activating factor acetylhydrolase IB subunit [Verrucomicrobiae bacterium]
MKKTCLSLLIILALGGLLSPASSLAENTASTPVPRDAKWLLRHEGFIEQAKKGGIDVLFVGDSITDHWRDRGSNVWEAFYVPLHAANFGISSDRTQHVLWRIENGELSGIHPKVIVLMIGTNNTGKEKDKKTIRNTPAEVVEGVKAIVEEMRAKLPETKILLLAIFPRAQPGDPFRTEINEINTGLARLDHPGTITYLDIGQKFLEPDGTLSRDIMSDLLHPTEKGYKIWADAMNPTLDKMMK